MDNIFSSKKAKDLVKPDLKLVSVDSKETLDCVLLKLATSNIYSAPVYDSEKKQWLGFIALQDIVKFIVGAFATKASVSDDFSGISTAKFSINDCKEIEKQFKATVVTQALDVAKTHKWKTINEDATLQEVVDALQTEASRLPLVNAKGEIIGIISKSTVINFIKDLIDDDPRMTKSLKESHIGTSGGLLTATNQHRAIDAFAKIGASGISHLALINEQGALFGNVSVKDIRKILDGGFQMLLIPIFDYINAIRREVVEKDVHPAIHANENDTVGRTLKRLAIIKIHRLYITHPGENVPIGVVTLGDILKVFSKKEKK